MSRRRPAVAPWTMGLCLITVLCVVYPPRWRATDSMASSRAVRPLTGGPFDAAMRQAWERRTQVRLTASRALEAMEAWDPALAADGGSEWLRRELTARDAGGELKQSRALVRQAAGLARSAQERRRAAALLARIECDRGDHEAELRQARVLMALAPEEERSRQELRHARVCLEMERQGQR